MILSASSGGISSGGTNNNVYNNTIPSTGISIVTLLIIVLVVIVLILFIIFLFIYLRRKRGKPVRSGQYGQANGTIKPSAPYSEQPQDVSQNQASAGQPPAKFCRYCGATLSGNEEFCTNCGKKLN